MKKLTAKRFHNWTGTDLKKQRKFVKARIKLYGKSCSSYWKKQLVLINNELQTR